MGPNDIIKLNFFSELKDHLLPAWHNQYEFFSTIDCLILLALIYSLYGFEQLRDNWSSL